MASPRGRVKLYRVWIRQDGLCPTCQEPIAPGAWATRFIVKRTEGGSNAAGNIQLHHPECHGNQNYAGKIGGESGFRKTPSQRLEPSAPKGACSVLRGGHVSNDVSLPN